MKKNITTAKIRKMVAHLMIAPSEVGIEHNSQNNYSYSNSCTHHRLSGNNKVGEKLLKMCLRRLSIFIAVFFSSKFFVDILLQSVII